MKIKFAFVVVSVRDPTPPRPDLPPLPGPNLPQLWFDAMAPIVRSFWHEMSGGRVQLTLSLYSSVELQMTQAEKDALSAPDLITAIRVARRDTGDPFDDEEHLLAIMDDLALWPRDNHHRPDPRHRGRGCRHPLP